MSALVDSYYAATCRGGCETDPFESGRRFDVVVVGGGLTGLNAAIELARRGIGACVVERHVLGWGASGRSGGQIIGGLGVDMDELEHAVGADTARALFAASLESMADLRRRIDEHGIDCDLVDGHLVAAHDRRHAAALEREADLLSTRFDYPVQYLGRGDLAGQVATDVYHGGLLDPRSGHLHPLNYTLGVARIARAAGVTLYENCAVERIGGEGPYRLACSGGEIHCDHVLLCANAYLERLQPSLARHVMAVGSHIVATRPLGREAAERLLPARAAVADTRRVLDYYRLSADHRLLFGGRVGLFDPGVSQLMAVMSGRIARVFPHLAAVDLEYAWGGCVAVTRSHAPHIGRLRGGIYHAHGYSGHGMVLSGIAGKVLAEAVSGSAQRLALFSRIPNPPIPLPLTLHRPAIAIILAWYRLLDRI